MVEATEVDPGDDAAAAQLRDKPARIAAPEDELPQKWRVRIRERQTVDVCELRGEVVRAACARSGDGAHSARTHVRHVRGGRERHQRMIGADVGCRVLAPDVLLTRLQRQRVGAPAVAVAGEPDQAPRHAPDQSGTRGEAADVRTAERRGDAERLTVADRDVESQIARWREDRARDQIGAAHGKRAGRVRRAGDRREVVDRAEERQLLHEHARVPFVEHGAHRVDRDASVRRRDQVDLDPSSLGERPQYTQRFRMHGVRHRETVSIGGLHRHHHGLRRGGRAVVQRRVGHLHAGELADHRLEFEDGLQRAL